MNFAIPQRAVQITKRLKKLLNVSILIFDINRKFNKEDSREKNFLPSHHNKHQKEWYFPMKAN